MSDNIPSYRQIQHLNNNGVVTIKGRQMPFFHLQQPGNVMIKDNEASFSYINDPSPYVVPSYKGSNSEPFGTQQGFSQNSNEVFNTQVKNTILDNNGGQSLNPVPVPLPTTVSAISAAKTSKRPRKKTKSGNHVSTNKINLDTSGLPAISQELLAKMAPIPECMYAKKKETSRRRRNTSRRKRFIPSAAPARKVRQLETDEEVVPLFHKVMNLLNSNEQLALGRVISGILSNGEDGGVVKSAHTIPHTVVLPNGSVLSTHENSPDLHTNVSRNNQLSTTLQDSSSKKKSRKDIFKHPIFNIHLPSTSDTPEERAHKVSNNAIEERANKVSHNSYVKKEPSFKNVASTSNAQLKQFDYVQPIAHVALTPSSEIVPPSFSHLPQNIIENGAVHDKRRFEDKKSDGLFDIGFSSFMDWLNSNDNDLNEDQTIGNCFKTSTDQSHIVTPPVQPVAIPSLPTVSSSPTIAQLPVLEISNEELDTPFGKTDVLSGPLSSDNIENIVTSCKRKLDEKDAFDDDTSESKRPKNNTENTLFDDFTDFLDKDVASLKRKVEDIDSNDEDVECKRMKTYSGDMESDFDVDFTDLMDWIDSDSTSFEKMMN